MKLWDEAQAWDAEIAPLVKQIHKLCDKHKIPMILVAGISKEEDGNIGTANTGLINIDERIVPNITLARLASTPKGFSAMMAVAVKAFLEQEGELDTSEWMAAALKECMELNLDLID